MGTVEAEDTQPSGAGPGWGWTASVLSPVQFNCDTSHVSCESSQHCGLRHAVRSRRVSSQAHSRQADEQKQLVQYAHLRMYSTGLATFHEAASDGG